MVWNQLERLIAEIPERQAQFENKKEGVARLEEDRRKQAQVEALKRERQIKAEELLRRQKQPPEQDQELGQSL